MVGLAGRDGLSPRSPNTAPELVDNTVHTWDHLGERFGFAPDYLGAAGGMISRPDYNALLIITTRAARGRSTTTTTGTAAT